MGLVLEDEPLPGAPTQAAPEQRDGE